MDLFRNQLYDRYRKQGMSEEDALMKADRMSQVKETTQKEEMPSNLELLWYGKQWWRKKGQFRKKKQSEKSNSLTNYARQTGTPDLSSAGSDAKMLQERFFRKK